VIVQGVSPDSAVVAGTNACRWPMIRTGQEIIEEIKSHALEGDF